MNIVWRKIGRIYVPSGEGFFKTHTTRAVPYRRANGTLRLFFASRGADDMPYLAFIDVDADDPARVLAVCPEPMIALGRTGTFDDSGFTPACVVRQADCDWLYYSGFKRRRWGVTIEMAIG